MAKQRNVKSNTTLQYEKELKRIKSFTKSIEKRGFIVDESIIPTRPKRITKASVKRLQKITPQEIYNKSSYIDIETGEILSGKRGKQLEAQNRAKKSARTRKAKRKAEQEFWGGSTTRKADRQQVDKSQLPNGGEIIVDNSIDDFIMRLSQPTPQYTHFSTKRRVDNYEVSERERTTLYSLTMGVISRDGKSELGWRLQDAGDLVWELLRYVLYGSDSTTIASASRELAEIINGSPLSMSDYADLAYEQEMNEDYEYPQ